MIPLRTVCHRCGSTVVKAELSAGKLTIVNGDQLKVLAFWCKKCAGILCPQCASLSFEGEGIFLGYGFCLVCKQQVELADEQQIYAPMSPVLKKPLPKPGFLNRLFGPVQPVSGSFAYLFVVTQSKQPKDPQVANKYLLEVANLCAPDWNSGPSTGKGKMGAYWESDAVDYGQIISWASQAFGEEFKTMSTKYDLSFSRFEHTSGNGQVLTARNR